MKHRVIKKWINRYITPLVKDMPHAEYVALELINQNDPLQMHCVIATRYTYVNGVIKQEGQIGAKSKGAFNDIKNAAETLKATTFERPYLRKMEFHPRHGMRIRIFDYKAWPEGYVYSPYTGEE